MTTPVPAPPPLPKHTRRRAPWILAIVLGSILVLSLIVNVALVVGRGVSRVEFTARGGMDQYPQLIERWSYGRGETKAVRIPLQGMIIRRAEGGLFGAKVDRVQDVIHQIRAARNDRAVRAIILEVDSPGGAITPTDEIYNELEAFKSSREDRVVIAFTRDLAASGGYYAAVAADWIIAQPTAVIGSIGVIMQSLNWKQLTDDIGITDVTIKSGANKDLLNPFQEVTTNQVALLQSVIDNMHDRFQGIVQRSRHLTDEDLMTLADGRIFTAEQALDYRLIDQVGYWEDAVQRTQELMGEDQVRFVRYTRQTDFFSLFSQVRSPLAVNPEAWLEWSQPRMMFLWRP